MPPVAAAPIASSTAATNVFCPNSVELATKAAQRELAKDLTGQLTEALAEITTSASPPNGNALEASTCVFLAGLLVIFKQHDLLHLLCRTASTQLAWFPPATTLTLLTDYLSTRLSNSSYETVLLPVLNVLLKRLRSSSPCPAPSTFNQWAQDVNFRCSCRPCAEAAVFFRDSSRRSAVIHMYVREESAFTESVRSACGALSPSITSRRASASGVDVTLTKSEEIYRCHLISKYESVRRRLDSVSAGALHSEPVKPAVIGSSVSLRPSLPIQLTVSQAVSASSASEPCGSICAAGVVASSSENRLAPSSNLKRPRLVGSSISVAGALPIAIRTAKRTALGTVVHTASASNARDVIEID